MFVRWTEGFHRKIFFYKSIVLGFVFSENKSSLFPKQQQKSSLYSCLSQEFKSFTRTSCRELQLSKTVRLRSCPLHCAGGLCAPASGRAAVSEPLSLFCVALCSCPRGSPPAGAGERGEGGRSRAELRVVKGAAQRPRDWLNSCRRR